MVPGLEVERPRLFLFNRAFVFEKKEIWGGSYEESEVFCSVDGPGGRLLDGNRRLGPVF